MCRSLNKSCTASQLSDFVQDPGPARRTGRRTQVFGMDAKQDEIFEHVAKPVVDDVLNGLNGTIFACPL